MSFYDLTKDNVLSANELFKYRMKRDATVPSKGGQKAFEPDGSWMHAKALESFMQERTNILGEQRVEKLKSLVQGVWEQDKRLVNLNKPGKFWAHMGFTDKRRNWLYPEEALFLMEANTLEVYHKDIPLSIQEAYNKLIGPDLSLEEYQVYSHLRRLGYVVLRQESQLEITPYERQINLDKYMTKQNRKERKQKLLEKGKNPRQESTTSPTDKKEEHKGDMAEAASTNQGCEKEHSPQIQDGGPRERTSSSSDPSQTSTLLPVQSPEKEPKGEKSGQNMSISNNTNGLKRAMSDEDVTGGGNKPAKRSKTNSGLETCSETVDQKSACPSDQAHISWYVDNAWALCFNDSSSSSDSSNHAENGDMSNDLSVGNSRKAGSDRKEGSPKTDASQDWFPLPTIANKSVLSLHVPRSNLLPTNVAISKDNSEDLAFDVRKYRLEFPLPEETKSEQREQDREARVRSLKFSFAEWMQSKQKIQASSWAEYKRRARELATSAAAQTPVDHLWREGQVTPLVRPQDSQSKQSILDRLDIIQTADNETLLPNSDCLVDLKVSYSVHLPDSKFKKSMPGTPNHRVCVLKCSSEPPNLAEIQEVWSRFKDEVPLHCAVVDSGEIAFYIFDNTFRLGLLSV